MQRLTQSQLLNLYKGNDSVIDVDKALRRAAAFGPPQDVETLISIGLLLIQ